jgi:hypothetical protein
VNNSTKIGSKVYLTNDPTGRGMALAVESYSNQRAIVVITTVLGEKLLVQPVQLTPGINYLPLDTGSKNQKTISFVTLYVNNQRIFTGKMLN